MSHATPEALLLLHAASTPAGFVASVRDLANYQRIWTRDGVITGLAALLSQNEELITVFRATLATIFAHQHATGFFPSNVDPVTHQASYGGNCGRVDNVSWAVVGLLQYAHLAPDGAAFAAPYAAQVARAFGVLDAWEFNGKHLVYVPQSGNWADEYVQHGYVLYDQLLRVWALELAARHYARADWAAQAAAIRAVLSRNYWPDPAADPATLYAPNLVHQLQKAPTGHWLLGFNPARVYPQLDLAANALALLLGLGTPAQDAALLRLLAERLAAQPGLLPAFSPAIERTDPLMAELADNYAYEFRNLPHEFHNGGRWPVWNGWLAAALHQRGAVALAADLGQRLAEANRHNPLDAARWGFYENLHGQTHAPIGVPYCTWSAAGSVLAEAYAQGQRLLTF
ncbi:MAG TPA: glycoside hydrolase 100 family protein [Hymenobacter sp.]|jgi:glycogen debranching enzyme|uniref:glycoside hydrolase 100 family protein n=1 Tax=Hymenobacter sp. TaxID=1898978 RepID=UPI002ED8316F